MALQDKIGRGALVDKICGFIDSLKKDSNFCLAINGAWGSGKSFVLGLIEEKLSKKEEYIVIKYDAWENTFYSDPLIAILSCVIDGIEGKLYLVERREEKIKKAAKAGANALAKLSSKIAKLKAAIDGIKEIIKSFHNPIDTVALSDFKSYQRLLKDTKEILNEVTQAGEYRQRQTKLIVLVDEIDRCLPDEQLKILERLHHLFDVKNCAVIVAMNQSSITATIHTLYGISGNDYLRKFFDLTFKLPLSAEVYLSARLNELLEMISKIGKLKGDFIGAAKIAYDCLRFGAKKPLHRANNRDLDRYTNSLYAVIEQFSWDRLNPYYLFFIIIALYIRKFLSSSFLDYMEICSNQQAVIEQRERENPERLYQIKPFYDYIFDHLGIDDEHFSSELQNSHKKLRGDIANYLNYFNEMVVYSTEKCAVNNSLRIFQNQLPIQVEDCKRLVQLIISYGGEQENARDER